MKIQGETILMLIMADKQKAFKEVLNLMDNVVHKYKNIKVNKKKMQVMMMCSEDGQEQPVDIDLVIPEKLMRLRYCVI